MLLWKNVPALIGAVFSTVFIWSILFPLIGIPLWIHGHRKARRWLTALEGGRATRGRLTHVGYDTSQSSNGRHPWRIEYRFDLHEGGEAEGFCEGWDPAHARRAPGDAVWIVYTREGERLASAVWPPLR